MQSPGVRGIKGVWKVASSWTPKDLETYFLFEFDPQDDPDDIEHTTWVHAFIGRPAYWFSDDREERVRDSQPIASSTLGRHREKYIGDFFETLNRIRLK